MSVLISKSKENLLSAQLLINHNCYASSVHCSYYSSVQLMIHLLLNNFNFTQASLEEESKKTREGSHVFAINHLFSQMKQKQEIFKAVEFSREIGKLKNKRVQADYKEEVISKDLSDDALTQAKQINSILTNVFSIRI